MEKKYRIVDAEERLPDQPDQYYTSLGLIDFVPKNGNFWDETDSYELYPNWWLEEVEDHEGEMRDMLEECRLQLEHLNKNQRGTTNAVLSRLENLLNKLK